jgi:hypothetical protein
VRARITGIALVCGLAGATVSLGSAGIAAAADEPARPGAYCPFPKAGETPVCFAAVEREYPDFLAAVGDGQVDDGDVASLEQVLRTSDEAEDRALALSSLAYGYFRLAERAASSARPDPALVARLESWNELLGAVYRSARSDPVLRSAVRDAALDLHARAPAVDAGCEAGAENPGSETCPTTSALLAALRSIDDPNAPTGVRGALENLVGRMLAREPDAVDPGSGADAPVE